MALNVMGKGSRLQQNLEHLALDLGVKKMAFDLLVAFVLSTLIMDQRSVLAQLRLVNRPANASVGAGRRASFGCKAVDQELRPVVISWSNGNQSTADSTFPSRFTFDSQSGVLNLDPVQCADARWYTCRVSTADESIDVRVHLNVVCRGRAPSFTRKLSSWYSFTPDQNSLLYCYSSGEPSPEISWHRQGVRLPTSKPTGGGPFAEDGVLNLQFSSSQDSGVYSCVAWNVFGSTTQDSRVVIRSDSAPILNSWWMVTLFVGVAMLASFLAVLVAVVCREFLLGRRGRTELVGKPKQKRNSEYPPTWDLMPLDPNTNNEVACHLVGLPLHSPEYQEVKQVFEATMGQGAHVPGTPHVNRDIKKIERVQNGKLWLQYSARKKGMDKDNPPGTVNEKKLFHGCASKDVPSINHTGFNRSYAGAHATAYGKGMYFARDASYSARYSSCDPIQTELPALQPQHVPFSPDCPMYLAKVLTGEFTKGGGSMLVPPPKNVARPNVLFDSVVDETAHPSIFVVFFDYQAYPDYLITFHT